MHILILNQTFYPDSAATAQHMWDFAQFMVAKGHRVTALASRNVYGTDRRAFAAREVVNGVEIVRVGGTAYGKKRLLYRMADFTSFYVSAAMELFRMPAPDVLLALTTPPMISALGLMRCRLPWGQGKERPRFVYYVMDVYPEAAVASGVLRRWGLPNRFLTALTARTLAKSDAIITLGSDMAELLRAHYGARRLGDRLHIVSPWADGEQLFPLPRQQNNLLREHGLSDSFNIVYSGNIGVAHDLETILHAIELTRATPGLCWVFIVSGARVSQLQAAVDTNRWTHVRILLYREREELNQSLNMADVHLVSELPAFAGIVLPSKLFGSMAVGRPIVMVGPANCECARIITEFAAGIVVPNGKSQDLVATLQSLRDDPAERDRLGANARQAFLKHYDRSLVCERLERLVCAAPSGAPAETAESEAGPWPQKRDLFGVHVSVTTYERSTACIITAAKQRQSACIDFTPLNILTDAAYDVSFRQQINQFDMTCPDGAPVRWCLNRYYDARIPVPVTGTGTTMRVCDAAAREGISVYLYGSTPEVIEKLQAELRERFVGLKIAGAESPPFRRLTAEEDEAMVQRVNQSGAGVVLVGLGSPKQENFAYEHRGRIQAVQMCVGAAFDFISGHKKRAPYWVQRLGMEWAFRLAREPRRLFMRVLIGNSRFLWLLLTRRPGSQR